MVKINIEEVLIDKINKSEWWHVSPGDPEVYKKRGKFLASTYQQAEFYGRPKDMPYRISIENPVYGFSEVEILEKLFPDSYKNMVLSDDEDMEDYYKARIDLDAAMFRRAKLLGYDSIVLLTKSGRRSLETNRKPNSIELNLLYP
jgi:hypothetical protein